MSSGQRSIFWLDGASQTQPNLSDPTQTQPSLSDQTQPLRPNPVKPLRPNPAQPLRPSPTINSPLLCHHPTMFLSTTAVMSTRFLVFSTPFLTCSCPLAWASGEVLFSLCAVSPNVPQSSRVVWDSWTPQRQEWGSVTNVHPGCCGVLLSAIRRGFCTLWVCISQLEPCGCPVPADACPSGVLPAWILFWGADLQDSPLPQSTPRGWHSETWMRACPAQTTSMPTTSRYLGKGRHPAGGGWLQPSG